jgi:2-dehydropantoate 2-reductase
VKVCVVGAGAVGTFIGVRLARTGCEMSALARGATAAALRGHGFRFQQDGATLTAPVRVAESARDLGAQDLVVVAVKAPALAAAAGSISALLGPETIVLPAMNGVPWWFFHGLGGPHEGAAVRAVDPGSRIAAAVPVRHVVGCVVHATCSVVEPGLVRHGFGRGLIIGEPAGGASARVTALADRLTAAGFETTVSKRIQADVWYKLWGNMTMNPMSALTGATCDRLLDDPLLDRFTLAIMAEAAAIGAKIGCPIAQSGEERNAVTRKLGAFKTSMLQDVQAGKPLEIDALLTAVSEIGERVGVATPSTDALLGLTRVFAASRGLYPADGAA